MSGSKGKPRAKRKGRDLERLVALVEKVLGPQAEVRSPDHLPNRDTSEIREVDVSIRLQVGSTPVLIIGECRDRKAVQDSTWIEQLAEKAKSVGAARALAVSRSGFYEPAIVKAKARGVEVRGERGRTRHRIRLPPEEAVAEDGLKDAPTYTTAHRQPGRKGA